MKDVAIKNGHSQEEGGGSAWGLLIFFLLCIGLGLILIIREVVWIMIALMAAIWMQK